ncbi:hypothetical protein [Novosphingobium album (ex Liu et al. 2023)]|nr:hypothetical protein [Novosphingobium album (ex Liu et al. 2023)]
MSLPSILDAHLDTAAIAAVQANPDAGYLIDAPYSEAPLVISFGFVSWNELPAFDFVGRTRKFEKAMGRPINRILVRDPANFWYLYGVPGLGHDVDAVTSALRGMIARLRPTSVSTVGQSMGGYAALMFGALLEVEQILSFGPLSYFRSDRARRDGDTRWLATMEKLDRLPPVGPRYDDLPALLASVARRLRSPVGVNFDGR